MNPNERWVVSGILLLITILVCVDILKDLSEGVVLWHVFVEGCIAAIAAFGIYFLLKDKFILQHQLEREIQDFSKFRAEAEAWKADSKKYIDGLSLAIDLQLGKWKLSAAEKEVALLLLKGLSLKEIADARKTSEKTARAQSLAVYSKSGLAGRAELSAFFLEDLLAPQEANTQ